MTRSWLLCLLCLLLIPGTTALEEGTPVHLTLQDACYDLCGGQFDYYWTDSPTGTPGKAPLTISSPAYSPYHANVDLYPGDAIEFTGPGTLSITAGCETVDPGTDVTFAWDIRLNAGNASENIHDSLPQPCVSDVQAIEFPINLTGGIIPDGDRLHMSISANTVNPQVASISNLYLVADDPAQPTSIDAPWRFVEANTTDSPLGDEGPDSQVDPSEGSEPSRDAPAGLVAMVGVALAALLRRR